MSDLVLTNCSVLDVETGALTPRSGVLVRNGRIAGIGVDLTVEGAQTLDLGGRTVMPGLIDCHMHVVAETLDLWANAIAPSSLAGLRAARVMNETLMRGFTTIRDLGGADYGLVRGVEEGLIAGPRIVICGKGLSTTGGHCDLRQRTDDRPGILSDRLGSMGILVDGVEGVRRVSREMIKGGAQFIKLMANGGVSSPNDPIHALQYSRDEIRAAVEEAENAGFYVSAHLYTDKAIRRAVDLGVHSLEHCNLITPETAAAAAEAGAIAVPTLVAYEALAIEGRTFGFGEAEYAKIEIVRQGGARSIEIMREAGLRMAFGSDLLGQLRKFHCMEFELLARTLSPLEIIQSATLVGAALCHLEGEAGILAKGAHADLIAVDGNPLDDLSLLAGDGAHMPLIMRDGQIFKNTLPA